MSRIATFRGWWMAVLVVAVVCPFLVADYRLYQLGLVGAYGVSLLGLVVIVGRTGLITVGHSALFAIGAYGTIVLIVRAGVPYLLAGLCGAVLAAACGAAFAAVATRLRGHNLAIVTLALGLAVPQVLNRAEGLTGGTSGLLLDPIDPPAALPLTKDQWLYFVALVLAVMMVLLTRQVLAGRLGRAFLAIKDHELAASSMGVPLAATKVRAFALGSLLAGFGGSLYALIVAFVSPESFQITLAITMLTGAVIGGVSSLVGAFVGAIFIQFVPIWVSGVSDRFPPDVIYGVVLIALLMLAPGGLASLWPRAWRRPAKRSSDGTDDVVPPVAPGRTAAGRQPLLVAEEVTVAFGGVMALERVSFAVPPGTVTGIIGPNGAGKTTLFNAVSRLQAVSSGSLQVGGIEITQLPAHRMAALGVQRTFQELALFESLSVIDNVLVGAQGAAGEGERSPRGEERRLRGRARGALEFVGLGADADEGIGELDYERRKRLELARAIAAGPSLLLLDEPAAGLNADERQRLARLLARVRSELGCTLLIVEHELDFLFPLCDTVVVLDFGRKIAEGPPAEVREDERVIEAYLGVEEARV